MTKSSAPSFASARVSGLGRRIAWPGLLFLLAVPCAAADEATPPLAALTATAERGRHLHLLGADEWHQAGMRGRGVKIAVLDSGFRGYRDCLGKALPANVTVRSFRRDGNLEARDSQHGILCGEVIHALAPEAELLFANWEADDADSFLEAVRWARDQGARIISCSVIMPSCSDGEGGGPVHERLARILGSGSGRGDVLLFACAGNTAARHWAGRFHGDANGWHEWREGVTENVLTPWGDERVSVELCCKPDARYELLVTDTEDGTVAARPTEVRGDKGSGTVVRFEPRAGHTYRVRVHLLGGKAGPFHVVALQAGLSETTARGSVVFPADGPEVVAVGAVDHEGRRASYSACGSETSQSKPDLVAPVPFACDFRSRPFAGTSAAAPQAAALAALAWSGNPGWSAGYVRTLLHTSARDLGPPGYDPETGFGLVHLPAPRTHKSDVR
jgi:subtilisin family serine protease